MKSQDAELRAVKAELTKVNAKLSAVKDGAGCSEEAVTWCKKYDAERKASLAARKEVEDLTKKIALEAAKKRQGVEADHYEKAKELRRKYGRAVTRHNDLLFV